MSTTFDSSCVPTIEGPTLRALLGWKSLWTRDFPTLAFAVAERHRPSRPVALGQLASPHPLSRARRTALTFLARAASTMPGERHRKYDPERLRSYRLRDPCFREGHARSERRFFFGALVPRETPVHPSSTRRRHQRRWACFGLRFGTFPPAPRCARPISATRNHEKTLTRALGSRPCADGFRLPPGARIPAFSRRPRPLRWDRLRRLELFTRGPLVDLHLGHPVTPSAPFASIAGTLAESRRSLKAASPRHS